MFGTVKCVLLYTSRLNSDDGATLQWFWRAGLVTAKLDTRRARNALHNAADNGKEPTVFDYIHTTDNDPRTTISWRACMDCHCKALKSSTFRIFCMPEQHHNMHISITEYLVHSLPFHLPWDQITAESFPLIALSVVEARVLSIVPEVQFVPLSYPRTDQRLC